MSSEVISERPARLRDYRYAGEVLSLALTFFALFSLYALATVFFPSTWTSTVKALVITMAGLSVYIISVKLQQRAAIGTMVRVSPRQFPELYDLAAKAAKRLSHPPVPVYVKRASEMNIYTVGLWQQPIIVLTSSLVDQMEPDNLQFFIGREIGHVAAGHIWLRGLLKPLGADVPVFGKLLNSVVFGDWINRTEFTADRAGFIACRSLTTAVSTMLKFGVGVRLFKKLDIKEFLAQINEVSNVRGHLTEIVAEQPYLTQRIRSLVRFSLSRRYKSLAPEKQSNTQILKAIPEKFVTSGIGFPDFESDEAEVDEAITITDFSDFDDENAPDPRLSLIASDGTVTYTLRCRLTRIGRSQENDIVLDSDRISRYHAEIVRAGEEILLVDKGSRNGVWVNRQRVENSTAIKSGDTIRIGRREFTFVEKVK